MKTKLIILFSCLIFSVFGQTYSQKWSDINYVGDGQVGHNLDIYLPQTVKDNYPVVIYIYGSAWQSNNSKTSDMNTVGAALLDAGYAVVSINHRSSTEAKWPAQINDVKAAIRFVRGNAAKYKFDTCFVGISGSSSGGHLSDVAGLSRNVKTFTVGSTTMNIEGTLGSYTSFSSSVDAVCDWFGPKYLIKMDSCGNTTQHGADDSPGSLILGCPIKQCTDNAAMLEPKTYIDPTDPPFLIFHGTADAVVPYCASVFLNKDLNAAGVQSEYVEVPGAGHYSNIHNATNFAKMVAFFNTQRDAKCNGPVSTISVKITSPANNAEFDPPATIAIDATATTTVGSIAKVEFYNGTTKIGEDLTSPYTYTWANVASGTYSITALATDNSNITKPSSAVAIKVNTPQGAYLGTAWPIPGTIEFEHFDVGGNGVAYLDNSADNTGGADFRMDEDVDIEDCTDDGGGYNLGFATGGEWLEYTVNVATAGKYNITFRAACSGDGRTISLQAKGVTVADNIAISSTAGWQTWKDVIVKDVVLEAGIQILRVTVGTTDYVNLNYMAFETTSIAPVVSITSPTDGSEFNTSETVSIAVTATATGATISAVKIMDGTTELTTDNTAPYTYDWTGMLEGSHTITIEVTDSNGTLTTKSITINVIPAPEVGIELRKGWNLVGYPYSGSVTPEVAFQSVFANVEFIKDMEGFFDTTSTPALNSLDKISFGKGYFVKVDAPCKLIWGK
ncbi:MAG: Ig-like domain-containing protein [Bacteroidales bacterium]|jgi:acetyl esterase/lipase|nr:Ig-like domain-containing protein [Bacteroidales bacterium]